MIEEYEYINIMGGDVENFKNKGWIVHSVFNETMIIDNKGLHLSVIMERKINEQGASR